MARRIVVVVSGGTVQGVYTDNPDAISISVMDCDDMYDSCPSDSEVERKIREATRGLILVDKF